MAPPLGLLRLRGARGEVWIEALVDFIILEAAAVSVRLAARSDSVKGGVTDPAFFVGTQKLETNVCVHT